MRPIAVFIAGDINIFFPAIVAMTSVQRFNPEQFDYFLCIHGEEPTDRMQQIMQRYGITFLSSRDIPDVDVALGLRRMQGYWPQEIFLNWLLPEYLADRGYVYSIKIDYDLMCIAPWNLPNILPVDNAVTALTTKARGIPGSQKRLLQAKFEIDADRQFSANVGMMVFNSQNCLDGRMFERFCAVYAALSEVKSPLNLLEQVVFSVIVQKLPGGPKKLERPYNHRVRYMPRRSVTKHTIVNLHYITHLKPWRPLTDAEIETVARAGRAVLVLYRGVWLEFASSIEGFAEFCTERPMTALDHMKIGITILFELERMAAAQTAITANGQDGNDAAANGSPHAVALVPQVAAGDDA